MENSTQPQEPPPDQTANKAIKKFFDDSFELFDLRVEVVCPPGAKLLCGAKPGDYFTLEGEMLHLPPDQGFSIYSLCMLFLSVYRLLFIPIVR